MKSKSEVKGKNLDVNVDADGDNKRSAANESNCNCACRRRAENDCATLDYDVCGDDDDENTAPRVHGILTSLDFLQAKSFCKLLESSIEVFTWYLGN